MYASPTMWRTLEVKNNWSKQAKPVLHTHFFPLLILPPGKMSIY
jgi:hypothetical protein